MTWLVTFQHTVSVSYDKACVEEEAIAHVCKNYDVDEADIIEVIDDKY